jgi:phospholipid/cholesterol/gamma-HCH transport system substrate-binding protein
MQDATRLIEVAVGLFTLLGLAALFFLALQASNFTSLRSGDSYTLYARFQNIGGLKVRAPVTMGGVRIGRVAAITLDEHSFEAVAALAIDTRYSKLPRDSSAKISTSGLIGEQYISLEPGGDSAMLRPGDSLILTQSALVLEDLVSKFLFNQTVPAKP